MGSVVEEIYKITFKMYSHLIRKNNQKKKNEYLKLNLGGKDGDDQEKNGNNIQERQRERERERERTKTKYTLENGTN